MRLLLLCCLMFPVVANSASVLWVPTDEAARRLTAEVMDALRAAKLEPEVGSTGSPASRCLKRGAARDTCLRALSETVLVGSGTLKSGRGRLTLELVVQGISVAKERAVLRKGRIKAQVNGLIGLIVKLVRLRPTPDPTVALEAPARAVSPLPEDAPAKAAPPVLAPSRPADEVQISMPLKPAAKPRVAAWVVTGIALAAAGTAATFGGLGIAGKERLDAAPAGISPFSRSEAAALQESTNLQFTVALGTGIGAGVSGVVAAILWGAQ